MNIENFIDYLKNRQHSHSTLANSKREINLFLNWVTKERMELEQITYQDMLGFMKSCSRKGVSQRTLQHYLNTVKHFFDHLIEENKITINPVTGIEIKGVKRKTLYHILEPHDLNSLYNSYKDVSLKGKRNQVMLGLLVYQGLKTEELARLEVNHIKLREGQIEVPGGKKSNHRTMKLEAHQVMDIYDYTLRVRPLLLDMKPMGNNQTKQITDKLLIGEGGITSSFSSTMTRLMVKLRKINPNVLNAKQIRASVITKWLKAHNLRESQYLAGHRYISSTESYLENDLEGLQEEVQQFHPLG